VATKWLLKIVVSADIASYGKHGKRHSVIQRESYLCIPTGSIKLTQRLFLDESSHLRRVASLQSRFYLNWLESVMKWL